MLALLCYSLRTFLDLGYLLRYEPVSLPVDGFRRFFVRGFGKAEDLATLLVVPVPMVLNSVLLLDFEVFLWASATASAVNPSTPLWWSMKSGIAPILLSPLFPSGLFTLGLYPVAGYKRRSVTNPMGK